MARTSLLGLALSSALAIGCGAPRQASPDPRAPNADEGSPPDEPVAAAAPNPETTPPPAPPPPAAAPPAEPPPPHAHAPRAVASRTRRAPPRGKHAIAMGATPPNPRSRLIAPPVPVVPPGTPIAGAPIFSRLPDGTSRISVEVSHRVDVVESRLPAHASYRLRGAMVLTPTNELALPTEWFATPVTRVQLVPEGPDLVLRVDLREDLAPVYRVVDTPRGIVLEVDLPRGAAPDPGQPAPEEPPVRRHRARTTQTLGRSGPPEE